jgi:uncharacterized protein (DUF1697 family)
MSCKQIAFIRGINVGRAKRVAMVDLRTIVQELGYSDVSTILNSGNVIFTSEDTDTVNSATRIEEALSTRLGISAKVTSITAEELSEIVTQSPMGKIADNPSRLLVAILRSPEDCARLKLLELQDWTPEILALGIRVAYIWCPEGILASRLPEAVGRIQGDTVTTRNWATIMKLYNLTQSQNK